KMYVLDFFPYPSGDGLSVGHARNYVPTDVLARYFRMRGHAVLHPMGWDAFGLPAENEALVKRRHPRDTTRDYSANYRRQLRLIGCSYDWSREISTSDPEFYRWTQWGFLLLLRRGLAYRAIGSQWWCPKCRTILANEQVENGRCWRHTDTPVEKRELEQWYVRTTAYADRLLHDLERVDWPEHIKTMQRNWIGRFEEGGTVRYHLHDWLVSRQRYWGAPIPVVYCDQCGIIPVPEHQLPVLLPEVESYEPAGTGRSPLDAMPEFVHTSCPRCTGPARRETDTLDGFADSNWYFLRFADPSYRAGPWNPEAIRYWMPVDWYVGGAEQAIMHLLYARFFTKVLFDEGLIEFEEPFIRLRSQGSMLSPVDGLRMSKSRGNVVTPDEVVDIYGADALRVAVMFIGPFEQDVAWNPAVAAGAARFVRRLYRLLTQPSPRGVGSRASGVAGQRHDVRLRVHQLIKSAGEAIEKFRFNTLISELMTFLNDVEAWEPQFTGTALWDEMTDTLVRICAPVIPFVAEDAWHTMGREGSVHHAQWPEYDASLVQDVTQTVIIQINGRVRDRITVPPDADRDTHVQLASARSRVRDAIGKRTVKQVVVVPGKVINFVTIDA
ncbi:MAG: leucine--tRNA ligase, partial [bacterium]